MEKSPTTPQFVIDPRSVKGFLQHSEGLALYQAVLDLAGRAPCLEIGSYCGKSSLYLGSACKYTRTVLFALDHHQGSEEHQLGEQYHDPSLYNSHTQSMDSFQEFRINIQSAQLDNSVIPIVATSAMVAQYWTTPLSLVFIDGGHSEEAALNDYQGWQQHVLPQGILAIHDIFEDPAEGGQAPYKIMQRALQSGQFILYQQVESLVLLRCCRQ